MEVRHSTYRSGDYPTIVLVTDYEYDWMYGFFQKYANVIHVVEETTLTRIGRMKNLLTRLATKQRHRALRSLLLRLAKEPIPLKHLFKRIRDTIDAVIVVQPAFLPRERIPGAKYIYWSFDSHIPRVLELHSMLALEGYFDLVYATHSYAVEKFKEKGVEAAHLPYAVNTAVFYPRPVRREPAPIFVGTLVSGKEAAVRGVRDRAAFIREINRHLTKRGIQVKAYTAFQHDYAILVSKHMIMVDVPRRSEVNWRVFETTGAGGLLITEDTSEIREFFEPGREVLTYSNAMEAAEQIIWALENPEDAARAAARACEHAWRQHTMDERVCRIIRDLGYSGCSDPDRELREKMIERCLSLAA